MTLVSILAGAYAVAATAVAWRRARTIRRLAAGELRQWRGGPPAFAPRQAPESCRVPMNGEDW